MTNTLKAISRTDTELRVGNYIALFGGRDLEGIGTPQKNIDGSTGQYFTKATQFDSPYTDTGILYVDWEHGHAPEGEPQRDDLLGYVDWSTVKADEKGVFVERVLNRRNKYMLFLEDLIDAGLIGTSSEATQKGVHVSLDGEIRRWPLKRDTLTVAPIEPRMMDDNTLAAVKAMADIYPSLKALVMEAEDEAPTSESQPAAETPADDIESPTDEAEDDDTQPVADAEQPAPEAQSEQPTPEPDEDYTGLVEVLGNFIDTISERIGRL